jgi:hypothetical protein
LLRVLFGRQRDPQRTQNSFFAGFFMVTLRLTRDAVVKFENKRKEIIIEKNQNRINGWIDHSDDFSCICEIDHFLRNLGYLFGSSSSLEHLLFFSS